MGNNNDDPSANSRGEDKTKKAGAFALSKTPVVGDSDPGEVHKYELAPQEHAASAAPEPAYEDLGALPGTYFEDTIYLVARDPRWLFAYWDFDWSKYPAAAMRGGASQFFLRILKDDGAQEAIVEITPEARNWYVPVSSPDTMYFGEIGFFARGGGWSSIVASGATKTPPDSLAEDFAADFATVPLHLSFERMLDLVKHHMEGGETLLEAVARITDEGRRIAFHAGRPPEWTDEQRALLAALLGNSLLDRMGLGSDELDSLLRKQLLDRLHSENASGFAGDLGAIFQPAVSSLFSGVGASWSGQPFNARKFFMHVNAEIIFYGGTDPNATVWVDGNEIKLSPDGTFRYHFKLPDGDFAIPIVAQSPDGVERRAATLSFLRATEKTGHVTDTEQPPYLDPLIGKK